jgi:hypothetical protein
MQGHSKILIGTENIYLRSGRKSASDGCKVLHGVFRAHGLASSRLAGYDDRLIKGFSTKKMKFSTKRSLFSSKEKL